MSTKFSLLASLKQKKWMELSQMLTIIWRRKK